MHGMAAATAGDSIIMERFDGYYGGADGIKPVGPAKTDRIIFRIIPESASRVAALLAGEVDLINELPFHSMKRVENNPGAILGENMRALQFLSHPYAMPLVGWEAEIAGLTLEDALVFYQMSLDLNAGNDNAIRQMERIRQSAIWP